MSRIGELFVELRATGADLVRRSLEEVGERLRRLGTEARWTFTGLADMIVGSSNVAQHLSAALSPITGHLYGMFRQGLAASGAGQLLNLQMERLSHQIASIFVPQIKIVLDNLDKLVRWFRSLTGEQQETLRKTGLFIGAIMAAGVILPRVIAAVTALRAAFAALNAMMIGASLTNPWMLALAAIGLLLVALSDGETAMEKMANVALNLSKIFEGWAEGIKSVGELLGKLNVSGGDKDKGWGYYVRNYAPVTAGGDVMAEWSKSKGESRSNQNLARVTGMAFLPIGVLSSLGRAVGLIEPLKDSDEAKKREDLGSRVGGFEAIDATYKRIAQASLMASMSGKGGKPPEERTADTLEEILNSVRRLDQRVDDHKPAVR